MEDKRFRNFQGADQLDLFDDKESRWPVRTALAIILVVVAALFATALYAEEVLPPVNPEGYRDSQAHGLYHQKYQKMHNQYGTHCCSSGDCRPTTARWNETKKAWEAKLNGVWINIAADRHVVDAYGLTEFATICANEQDYVFCFIPPNSGY